MTWDEDQLSLGRPAAMDTDTLIEWIYRQLETEEETQARHQTERRAHEATHVPGTINACCINLGEWNTHPGAVVEVPEGMILSGRSWAKGHTAKPNSNHPYYEVYKNLGFL